MSRVGVDKFRFVSPGVQVAEVDQSVRRAASPDPGPCIIGRFRQGPTMQPTVINGQEELVKVFGNPITGRDSSDISRYGNYTAPSYAAYAAMAYLRNSENCVVVRVVGKEYSSAHANGAAGYALGDDPDAGVGGAYGLFLMPKAATASAGTNETVTGTLAAVWYCEGSGSVVLSGSMAGGSTAGQGASVLFQSEGSDARFRAVALSGSGVQDADSTTGTSIEDSVVFDFNPDSDMFIRKVFNTNPSFTNHGGNTATIDSNSNNARKYWLGPTFEGKVNEMLSQTTSGSNAGDVYGVIYPLGRDNSLADYTFDAQPAKTGWVFSQDLKANAADYDASKLPKLFRFATLEESDGVQKRFKISIDNIRAGAGDIPGAEYGTFDVVLRDMYDNDRDIKAIEAFTNMNLNPMSENYIGKRIGDQRATWDDGEKRYRYHGNYPNVSKHIRVELNPQLDEGALDPSLLPFGFYGMPQFKRVTLDPNATKGAVDPIGGGSGSVNSWASDSSSVAEKVTLTMATTTMADYETAGGTNYINIPHINGNNYVIWYTNGVGATDSAPSVTNGKYLEVIVSGFGTKEDIRDAHVSAFSGSDDFKAAFNGSVTSTDKFSLESKIKGATSDATEEGTLNGITLAKVEGVDSTVQALWRTGSATDAQTAVHLANLKDHLTMELDFPKVRMVSSASIGYLPDPRDRYFGMDILKMSKAGSISESVFDESLHDILSNKLAAKQYGADSWDVGSGDTSIREVSHYFSLDDVVPAESTGLGAIYISGSRVSERSLTAGSTASGSAPSVSPGFQRVLDAGYDKFTMPLYGGFDGFDIVQPEPIINNAIFTDLESNYGAVDRRQDRQSYEFYTLNRAIDSVLDPEVVDLNMITIPGLWDSKITDRVINAAESRADALAIIDLKHAYTPQAETTDSPEAANNYASGNTVANAVTYVKTTRKFNSSYAATYYPWVQIRDNRNGMNLWVPPSVIALGAISYSQSVASLWFAPAGFNRGGLSDGSAGYPVLSVSQRLTKKERDSLYENAINPIAQFPSEGIVIFGQKTLQKVPSALDRINVRRLLIFIKKRISRMANQVLFDPNVDITWNRFKSLATPFLANIKAGYGLEDFRIILDKSTTTPDLIDRNIMYAKVLLKPTKAIEFIAIDFVVTNQGASFDD